MLYHNNYDLQVDDYKCKDLTSSYEKLDYG